MRNRLSASSSPLLSSSRSWRTVASLACALAFAGAVGCAHDENPEERAHRRRASVYEGPVIDVHAHLGTDDDAFLKNAADPHVAKIGAVVIAGPSDARALNDRALALAQANPKVFAVASVSPADPGADAEIDRVVSAGAKMIALDPYKQGFDVLDPRVGAVVQHCGERGVVVLLEADGARTPGVMNRALDLATAHPQTLFVLGHMGLTHFNEVALFARAKKSPTYPDNVYFDLSSTSTLYSRSPYADQLVWIIRRFPKNVLFGSDFPLDGTGAAVDALQHLGLEEDEQADVFYGNAARLLKLGPG